MSEQTMAALVAQCEATIALAGLAVALQKASGVDLRRPPSDPAGVGPQRELVFSFQSAADAEACFAACRRAAGPP